MNDDKLRKIALIRGRGGDTANARPVRRIPSEGAAAMEARKLIAATKFNLWWTAFWPRRRRWIVSTSKKPRGSGATAEGVKQHEGLGKLTSEEHLARHKELHKMLDELLADYIEHHPKEHNFLDMPVQKLVEWSALQMIKPDDKPNIYD